MVRRFHRDVHSKTLEASGPDDPKPVRIDVIVTVDDPEPDGFVCADCGRTDLPPAGDWDPPICSECDAAINFDAIEEVEYLDQT